MDSLRFYLQISLFPPPLKNIFATILVSQLLSQHTSDISVVSMRTTVRIIAILLSILPLRLLQDLLFFGVLQFRFTMCAGMDFLPFFFSLNVFYWSIINIWCYTSFRCMI